jgi:bacteriocin-like protein
MFNFAVVFWLANPITSVEVGLGLTETKERNMSDENRNENEKGKEVHSPKANQLSEQELKKVSGGGGDIGPTTDGDKHKDWSE